MAAAVCKTAILRIGARVAPDCFYTYMDSFRDSTNIRMERSLEEFVVTKKQKIMEYLELIEEGLTEKAILQKIGDNRYSREIIRNLLQSGLISRVGKVQSTQRRCIFILCHLKQTHRVVSKIHTGYFSLIAW